MLDNFLEIQIAEKIITETGDLIKKISTDTDVKKHSERVCKYSLILAKEYGLNLQKSVDICTGALLHDIGKIYINKNILNKKEKLNEDEKCLINYHSQIGYLNLKPYKLNAPVLDIVHHHHERLDGNGYPEKLFGNEISLLTQLVSVADVFDALTSDRVYRNKMKYDKAFIIMKEDKGLNQLAIHILQTKILERM